MALTLRSLTAKPVVLLAALLLVAIVSAGLLAPCRYDAQDRDPISAGVSRGHLLGTDDLGRDRFSRLLFGLRTSLLPPPAAPALTLILGSPISTTADPS